MNGGILNPKEMILVISACVDDVRVFTEEEGRVTIAVANLSEGIEIVHDEENLWWPV